MASGGVWPAAFLDGTPYPTIPLGASVVTVASSSQLTTALNNAVPGHRILLAGTPSSPVTYSGAFALPKVGTSSAGITVEALQVGGAIFAPGSTWTIKDAAYVTIKGLYFPYELGSGNLLQFRGSAHHCRVTRCLFGPATIGTPGGNKATFVFASNDTEFIRVDHNEFRNKANPGNAVLADGNFDTNQAVRYFRFDHNWVHSVKPEVDNEKEPLRLGVSSMSKSFSYSVVERNVFEDCIAEPEVLSIKASGVRVSGNVIHRCIGGPVYRHGTDGVMSDNYVVDGGSATLNTGGGGDNGGGDGGGGEVPPQTLGVGGIATATSGPNVTLIDSDSSDTLNITESGTTWDGQGHTVKKIDIEADNVTVQNFYIRGADNSGIYSFGTGNTIQNCDIAQVNEGGVGDINAITFFGDGHKILYNNIDNLVQGDPNGSHTDGIQTWNTPSKRSSSNITIKGNRITGPPQSDDRYIHQGVQAEGKDSTDGGGGGSGVSQNWLVEGNYFKTYGNQVLHFDDIHDVLVTKNTFDGSTTKIVAIGSFSTGITFADDNLITGDYGSTIGS